MRVIGIPLNLPTHGQYTGVERYLFELIRAMMRLPLPADTRIELYSSAPLTLFGELPKGWTNIVLPWRMKGWTHIRLSAHLLRHAPDILFVPAHEIPLITRRARVIATVHDVAFAAVPDLYSKKEARRQYWAIARVLKKSAHVLAVSNSTKQDLVRIFHIEPERVDVTQLASTSTLTKPDESTVQKLLQEYHIPYKQYLLYVGRLEHKKGIVEFLRVYDEYKKSQGFGDPLHLVLIGKYGFGGAEIQKTLIALGRKDIHALGFLEDEKMAGFFAGARAFVFPTRYEGFGIPLLEAMQFDLPIITTNLPITHEVAGDSAVYAEYGDMGSWMRAMRAVLRNKDIEDTLVESGRAQRDLFSWDRTAQDTLSALLK